MSKGKLTGIKRQTKYSPNHIGNDGTIYNMTAQCLRDMGYDVQDYTESEFVLSDIKDKFIFDMARDKSTIKWLKHLEDNGSVVINSAYGIENCTRGKMTRMLIDNNIPHPESIIIDSNDDPTELLEQMDANAYWIKRGDFHAIHREDVAFARSITEAKEILKEFAFRGIPNAVINEHLVGDLVKFYGVADTDFFYHFYPFDLSHSKFGLEEINGAANQYAFSVEALKEACDKAGEILNIKIYGGDCVVAKDGSFKIIDFNDWPSFAPCREQAAPKIAECIDKHVQKHI
ncbi:MULTISPECIES: hypothetical protein [unclassified Dysgonomonas]|uniref:hypothetical protein n=1 Tax=unclassified Dysgonomonas TaxID=2630389 RepID=UPI000680ACBF|nr:MULTISPECIES: hypothetical protein [unclassified Dysgonomonas]MBD8349300.1 hypothetical protein [Dysgonomonas sp. HGC4]MBF0578043.1 hypothetical protein [Dysgonomonas sp. GY617]